MRLRALPVPRGGGLARQVDRCCPADGPASGRGGSAAVAAWAAAQTGRDTQAEIAVTSRRGAKRTDSDNSQLATPGITTGRPASRPR